ncbi:YdcF family protein [Rarobacter incanus]|uniref:Uncharacterized SAM-binding protein YcdF (DUF218 family) n=1 Tax=Rarobacter incanus TaxID=153494 RepID=A0A542SM53_9MICO|nr:YdcF family protein [Rarobacter incanus]TQK75648.1 uncharacterized SAM-binding protein YcdF (DUF218 family) [Rarobacter incanus]
MIDVWIVAAALSALTAYSAWRDPRKVRIGVYLLSTIVVIAFGIVTEVLVALGKAVAGPGSSTDQQIAATNAQAWVLFGVIAVGLLSMTVIAVFLILTGVLVVRREGRSLSHALALITGGGILAFLGAMVWSILTNREPIFLTLVALTLPAGYIGFGLIAYLLWSRLYVAYAGRVRRKPIVAVIVLGSGLIRGLTVTPLLAARVERGIKERQRWIRRGSRPVLIVSGGQGPRERVSEAAAMADYAFGQGLVGSDIRLERRSRTTMENLEFSRELLRASGPDSPVAIATSSFHAFRAAIFMRKMKWRGYAVGSPTAGYYWPTAFLREYIAVLREHLTLNVIAVAILLLPFAAGLVASYL